MISGSKNADDVSANSRPPLDSVNPNMLQKASIDNISIDDSEDLDSDKSVEIPSGELNGNIPLNKSGIPTTDDQDKQLSYDRENDDYTDNIKDYTRNAPIGSGLAGAEKRQDDSFARVTWTDLATGKKSAQGGRRTREGMIDSGIADYSLAQHNKRNQRDIQEVEDDDVLSATNGSIVGKNDKDDGDDEAPQEFKPTFVRRKTIARQQLLEQIKKEDEEE